MTTGYFGTTEEELKKAAEIIKAGGLVAFPTETVYGLGGNALDAGSSRAIYAAKGRPSDNPLIVHISEFSEVYGLAAVVPENAKKLADAIWPGPMTMVFPKKDLVPDETTGGLKTVAIRCPADEAARKLIKYSGVPIAAPSANLSGRPSPTRWEHVKHDLDGKCDAIIMGEPCVGGIESTVIDMTGDHPQILRPGLITPERVSEILGVPCDYDPAILGKPSEGLVPKAPGMKYKHYAPKADMTLFSGKPAAVRNTIEKRAEALRAEGKKVGTILYDNGEDAARDLFDDLRTLDEQGCEIILASALAQDDSINYSVMNRMLKAAGYRIEEVNDMKMVMGSDHGGFELKNAIAEHLKERGFEIIDVGTYSEESVDYPIYGRMAAEAVAGGQAPLGIVCCGTGIGISIAANKVHGIRCAVATNTYMAEMTKRHNNANMLALGGRVLSADEAIAIVDTWLDAEFEGGRHQRRIDMLDAR